MKKKKIIKATVIVLIIALLATIICVSKPGRVARNITITVSSQLVKTDVESSNSEYYDAYLYYGLKDEYEYYSCIVKIENNSKDTINNVEFKEMTAENFRIDYFNHSPHNFSVPPNKTGYVTCIISVKKGLPQDELNKIVYNLPKTITIEFNMGEPSNENNERKYFLIFKEYDIVDEDFSGYDVQTHSYI